MSDVSYSRNDPLDTAINELKQVFPGSRLEIERVDVDASGCLQFTAITKDGSRWFTHDDRGLVEQTPLDDAEIPLSSRLAHGKSAKLETISYRPGRRMVIQECLDGSLSILKGYRKKKSTAAMFNHRVAEDAADAGSFQVPRLIRQEKQLETLVFEHLEGTPFHVDESATETCFRIGSLLKRFQDVDRTSDLKIHRAEDELGVIDAWRRKALAGTGKLPSGFDAARGKLDKAMDRLPEPEWGLCHRDLHDGQILMVGGKPALMDFDLLCKGDTALDPANLLAHFSLRSLQGFRGADERTAEACGNALLDGLDHKADAFWNRLRFYQGTAFLRLSLVYLLRPRWVSVTPSLVELAKRCLEEQIRIG